MSKRLKLGRDYDGWAIKLIDVVGLPAGEMFIYGSFWGPRKDTIAKIEKDLGATWKELYHGGYRCVRVKLEKVK